MDKLLSAALAARKLAYAPYSHFAVGAAVETESGAVYAGCNIENASFGLANCAERTAIFKAVSSGERRLIRLAVVADSPLPASPCGACRQVMTEFGIRSILMANLQGAVREVTMQELLPFAFDKSDMPGDDTDEQRR